MSINERVIKLSKRQEQIANLLREGLSYKAIAKNLFISVNTVKFHCKNIYRIYGASNRNELIHKRYHVTSQSNAA